MSVLPAGLGFLSPAPLGVRLAGTGMAAPATILTNADLAKRVDTTDEWIAQRTGIRQRHVVEAGESVRTLACAALKQALHNAQLAPTDLDLVIHATLTPEMCCPSTAARIVSEIGASPAGALDLSAACSGFVYGLNLAWSMIRSGACRTVAVVGAEALSTIVNWQDRGTCVLFGDGAGAAILQASGSPDQGCLYQTLGSDGSGWAELYCPRDPNQLPAQGKGAPFTGTLNTLHMNGREVYKFAVATLHREIDQALRVLKLNPNDLTVIIPHQSNARIMESARDRLGLPTDKLYINIDRYGNTSAASVPICLHELNAAGRLKAGDLVLFVGLGGGLTWATSLWRL